MEYGYSFDDESPRFALSSLWFLLGVIVFAFTVLVMTAIVSSRGDSGYYLNAQKSSTQQTKPVTSSAGVTTTVESTPVASGNGMGRNRPYR
jgi:hypothetical protein